MVLGMATCDGDAAATVVFGFDARLDVAKVGGQAQAEDDDTLALEAVAVDEG